MNSERKTMDIGFVTAFAQGLSDNGALTKLVLRDNKLATAEAGEALGEALKGNTVLKELDISSNSWSEHAWDAQPHGLGFAEGISKGLACNRALTKLTFGDKQVVTMTTEVTEANFSAKGLGQSGRSHDMGVRGQSGGLIMVAAFLPKCT
jgi:hypothetical protein